MIFPNQAVGPLAVPAVMMPRRPECSFPERDRSRRYRDRSRRYQASFVEPGGRSPLSNATTSDCRL